MKFFKLLLISTFFLSLPHFIKKDFKVPPTHADIGFNPEWAMPPPDEKILSILKQPFTYLTHGNQSTVFVSEDGEYVLKLFRYTRPRFPLIHDLKSAFANLTHKNPKNDLYTKAYKTFTAAHIACTEASQFTQVLYCHLNLTKNQFPSTQFKTGKTFTLPLDRYRFVLQKKVKTFKETLLSARNNPEEMHQLIDSFLTLLIQRSSMGIRNSDPNLGPNFGFLNGQAVEIDFGNYRKPPFSAEQRRAEITNFLNRFEQWLKKNTPEYIAYFIELRYHLTNYEDTGSLYRSTGTLHRDPPL